VVFDLQDDQTQLDRAGELRAALRTQ